VGWRLAGLLTVVCWTVAAPIGTGHVGLHSFANAAAPEAALKRFSFERVEMAVPVRIVLYAPDERSASTAATAAMDEIHRLNGVFSDYDARSELRRLCETAAEGRAVPVSEDLWTVLRASQRIARQSDGAFDVTIGPVVRLWRRARRQHELPSEGRLAEARRAVGYELIRLLPERKAVELQAEGMRLDLGGIAKGYAIDAALDVLRRHGIPRALVDAGGDVRVGDPPPGQSGWHIRVATGNEPTGDEPSPHPREGLAGLLVLNLANAAVATSGDAWQSVEIDGVHYSHIVDPRTGVGLTDRSTVTVVAPSGMLADALASAVSVLGPEKGIALVDSHEGTAVRVVRASGGEPEIRHSRSWEQIPRIRGINKD
jgi:thiamine biosynthesis lipoprotein